MMSILTHSLPSCSLSIHILLTFHLLLLPSTILTIFFSPQLYEIGILENNSDSDNNVKLSFLLQYCQQLPSQQPDVHRHLSYSQQRSQMSVNESKCNDEQYSIHRNQKHQDRNEDTQKIHLRTTLQSSLDHYGLQLRQVTLYPKNSDESAATIMSHQSAAYKGPLPSPVSPGSQENDDEGTQDSDDDDVGLNAESSLKLSEDDRVVEYTVIGTTTVGSVACVGPTLEEWKEQEDTALHRSQRSHSLHSDDVDSLSRSVSPGSVSEGSDLAISDDGLKVSAYDTHGSCEEVDTSSTLGSPLSFPSDEQLVLIGNGGSENVLTQVANSLESLDTVEGLEIAKVINGIGMAVCQW